MAAEGKNKVASSLLDLQPTAILELFKVFPDRINKPNLFLGFHGGTLYDKSLVWQGQQSLPLAIESDGFDILADGQLARPKIKVTNKGNIVTNLLQNHKDFINAKLVRKRVSVKFLDDSNFDGGNPFGIADPKAELTNQEWIVGRKISESKIFVEFELNSPLDLESFNINSRGVVSKFCYWQYRGEGCRYQGQPIERQDGASFTNVDGESVVPRYVSPVNVDASGPESETNFFFDPNAEWSNSNTYIAGDVVYIKSPTINIGGEPLKTVYVCVSGNSSQSPENNTSFWQKDGCTKRFSACQKRFNNSDDLSFNAGSNIASGFSGVRFSGAMSNDGYAGPVNSGLFHTTIPEITGALTGDFTIVGWASMNQNSPIGAGLFSTTSRDKGFFPACRYINILGGSDHNNANSNNIYAYYQGERMSITNDNGSSNDYRIDHLTNMAGPEVLNREWNQYAIIHDTGVQNVIDAVDLRGEDPNVVSRTNATNLTIRFNNEILVEPQSVNGNFANLERRENLNRNEPEGISYTTALPEVFRLGAVQQFLNRRGFESEDPSFISTMNGCIGPWALWSRKLTNEELNYLHKTIRTPDDSVSPNDFDHAPRDYYECTGRFQTITGDSLIAWWDGSTGNSAIGNGLVDIHTVGPFHLTGSGQFSGFKENYNEGRSETIKNPTTEIYPRFGGFPGTDGFSYERTSSIY